MLKTDGRFGYLQVESIEELEEKLHSLTIDRDSCERFLQRQNVRPEAKLDVSNDIMYLNDIIDYIEALVTEKKSQKIM